MRLFVILFAILLVALAAPGDFVPAATAQEIVNVWEGTQDGQSWSDQTRWSLDHPPTNTEVALIDNGKIPYVTNGVTGYCKRLVVNNDNGNGSGVKIEQGGTLIIGDGDEWTSSLEKSGNELEIVGTLKISGIQTFIGKGTIRMSNEDTSLIQEANGADDLLVLETECVSSPIDRGCSITLAGKGNVAVAVDNRSFVVADYDGWDPVKLSLTTRPKTTSGGAEAYWICENGGTMFIYTTITGSGHWEVADVNCKDYCAIRLQKCNGTIVVDAGGCVRGTGDVVLEAGCGGTNDHQLKVRYNTFCTTGNLTWRSVSGGPNNFKSSPSIFIDDTFSAYATAMFGLSSDCDSTLCSD
ncbi:MAG: hypothetical protein C4547_10770 [Phycisphaerales bacterium]|nr:MAG: hypothetical protein C4547_10770 [Phycisphaerales bacterium]